MNFSKHKPSLAGGVGISLPLFACVITPLLAGCNSSPNSFEGSSVSAPATTSPAIQSDAEKLAAAFVSAIQTKTYVQADALSTPEFQKHVTSAQWEQGDYHTLVDAKDLSYSPVQMLAHGTKAVLRAQFTGSDTKTYHTNFIFIQDGAKWKIDDIVAPVFHQKPVGATSATASGSGGH